MFVQSRGPVVMHSVLMVDLEDQAGRRRRSASASDAAILDAGLLRRARVDEETGQTEELQEAEEGSGIFVREVDFGGGRAREIAAAGGGTTHIQQDVE